MIIFNKLSFHDDVKFLFDVGTTYQLGRWFLAFLANLSEFIFGQHFSIPVFNGFFTFLFISLSSCLIINLLNIKYILARWLLCCLMIVFPVISSTFAFMFTSIYYAISLFLATFGAWLICRYKNIYYVLGAILSICCSIGIYQSYLSVSLCLMLIFLIKLVIENTLTNSQLFKYLTVFFIVIACSLVLYFIITNLCLSYKELTLSSYKNISTMGQEGIYTYLTRCLYVFKYFFNPVELGGGNYSSLFPMFSKALYFIILIFSILISALFILTHILKRNYTKALILCILITLMPLCENIAFIMCDPAFVNHLMLYGAIFHFIFFTYLTCTAIDHFNLININNILHVTCVFCLFLTILIYVRFDNIFYLKLDISQQRAISFYTTLITQIKSLENYKDDLPVVFINAGKISDKNISNAKEFDLVRMPPLSKSNNAITSYSWRNFLSIWCAYNPKILDQKQFLSIPEVKRMPNYPNYGAIKIINNVIVVKF